jgi:hypothetical protein
MKIRQTIGNVRAQRDWLTTWGGWCEIAPEYRNSRMAGEDSGPLEPVQEWRSLSQHIETGFGELPISDLVSLNKA